MKKPLSFFAALMFLCFVIGLATGRPEAASAGVSSPLIKLVNTDKARYSPGQPVTIYVDLLNRTGSAYSGTVTLYFRYLHTAAGADQVQSVSLAANEAKTLQYSWTPPQTDFRGYLVEAWARDGTGAIKDSGATAVDVSSDWTKFPRYGYVSEFSDTIDTANKTWELKNYHINALQFYDWQWKHHIPNPNPADAYWQDIGNRWIARQTVNNYINAAHGYNMKAMNYNLINGAYDNYWNDGVQVAWGLFKDGNGNYDPGRQDAHPLPAGWATSKIYLFNPANAGWQNYINGKESNVFQNFNFDGWHVDSLGPRGALYDWNRNPVSLENTYAGFINQAKTALNKSVVFNTVEAWGQEQISRDSNADFVYSELWDWNSFNDDYIDLLNLVDSSKSRSNKAVVFAAYMNRNYSKTTPAGTQRNFGEASVRLADAAMFASGASHIELGDGGYMLSDEYFPNKNLVMSDAMKDAMKNEYDFLTAYENLLRDDVVRGSQKVVLTDTANHPSSTDGQAGKIWTIAKAKNGYDIVHLINLKKNASTKWRDDNATYPQPDVINNIPMRIYYDGSLPAGTKVWWASPDSESGKANSLTPTLNSDSQGNYLEFTLPKLQYWDMIWIPKNPDENGVIRTDDYETTNVGAMPAGWTSVNGTWSVAQPAGGTKEFTVTSSSGGITKFKNGYDTGNYSVEGHVFFPNVTNNGAVLARMQQDGGFYQLELKEGTSWKLYKFDGSVWTELASGAFSYSANSYHYLKLSCSGNRLTVEIDLQNKGTYTDYDKPFMQGTAGLRSETGGVRWDNIKITGL